MKKEDKYKWKIGEKLPILDQHSATKHKIIESYIHKYLLTLMSNATIPKFHLTLVDGFAGGGGYLNELETETVDGSPLLMLRAVREARALLNIKRDTPRIIDIDYIFNDNDKNTLDHLKYWIECAKQQKKIDECDFSKINLYQEDFSNLLPHIVRRIKDNKQGERAIFVLDQYSYTLPIREISYILKVLPSAEIILTFNIASLTSFFSDTPKNRKALENINLAKYIPWQDIANLKLDINWKKILQGYLADGIQIESGAKFITPFFVRPRGNNSWEYWLIHLSNHYKAHDVMKELHWEYGTEFGHELQPGIFIQGYSTKHDPEDITGQSPIDFSDHSKEITIENISNFIGRKVCELNQPIKIEQVIHQFANKSTGGTEHFSNAIHRLQSTKNFIISRNGKIRRLSKHYSSEDIIEYSPQQKFFI